MTRYETRWLSGAIVALPCLLFAGSLARAESPYQMRGVVTDADTGLPVAKATIHVLIASEHDSAKKMLKAQSDQEGRYSVELPIGHAWAFTFLPPPGYCSVRSVDVEAFATTAEKPVFIKNYQVRQAPTVGFAIRYPADVASLPKTYIACGQHQSNSYVSSGFVELNKSGTGTITLPAVSGKFDVYCRDEQVGNLVAAEMSVEVPPGFDANRVLPDVALGDDGSTLVRDANGSTGVLRGCSARVSDNKLTIVIDVVPTSIDNAPAELRGRVVDVSGNGIDGALVKAAEVYSLAGGAAGPITATTDAGGRFAVSIPNPGENQQVSFVITRNGYAATAKPVDIGTLEHGDLGAIRLDAGCSIRVRAVGPGGSLLHGAVITPLNDDASQTRVARTGPDGECQLTDLAPGLMRISAEFGTLFASTRIPLQQRENELVVVKLAPIPTTPTNPADLPPTLSAGTVAPEWTISEWADGKQRKLSDYRGRVVVLDFWGIWCGPCVRAIPAMRQLHDRFEDREVVFVSIHTAGTDMSLIKRLLVQQEWDVIAGVDSGDDILSGETVRRYGVIGFPAVIIVDETGKISFNSGDVPQDPAPLMRELREDAERAGVPWPIDKDASEEEISKRMVKLQVVSFGRKIEAALNVKTE